MSTIDGLTVEERGGPEDPCACDMSISHYAGCACHEARWAAKLAASEERIRDVESTLQSTTDRAVEMERRWRVAQGEIRELDSSANAREAEVERLRAALRGIADDDCTSYRESGRTCEWLGQKWPDGYCYPCIARAALATPPTREVPE